MAFPADSGSSIIGAAVRQKATGHGVPVGVPVHVDYDVHGEHLDAASAKAQLARILSLDVDGTDFPALAERDPVVASLQAAYPGLRPVCFYSPYEAAAWTIIGNRIRMSQAAAIKAGLARDHGVAVQVAGQTLPAFPAPAVLADVTDVPGLTDIKIQRLHALADAALRCRLDAAALRALPAERALAALQELPGIGPFSAELILIRGAGHPDVFPRHEPRVHRAIAAAYNLSPTAATDLDELASVSDTWKPYRSWVCLLLRARAQDARSAQRAQH